MTKFTGATPPNDYDLSTETKRAIVIVCIPDSPLWIALYRGLLVAPTKLMFYRWDKTLAKPVQQECIRILNEAKIMTSDCFEKLNHNLTEMQYGLKHLLALLSEDKAIPYYIQKPTLPTQEIPNPSVSRDPNSVFQATRYLDPLAQIDQQFTIADIIATSLTDSVISLDPIGGNTLALESKVDKIQTELDKIDPQLTTGNSYLKILYQAFYAGFDIMPLIDQSFFALMRNALFSTGFLTDDSHLRKHNELLENGLFQSSTISHENSWLAKLGMILNMDYHLGEIQYGIKYLFNIFAQPTPFEGGAEYGVAHRIKSHWLKPSHGAELEILQQSIFQNVPDFLGRGFNFYDFMTMWLKPHGDNWQGNGYVNPSTNQKGHEPRTLDIGGLSALDTLIERFSLAFLQTSNTTSILGKIRDILETGLLFSPSLSILTLINNSLQSIHGVLDIDLGWIARNTEEIAAKDCCEGANSNGSDTVTNPDGSTTTTPRPPTYELIDPTNPDSPTREPYEKPPVVPPTANDSVCGFIYYWLNWVADWIEFLFNLLDPLQWLYKLAGYSGILDYLPKSALGGVWLQKIPSSRLRSMITSFMSWGAKHADDLNFWKTMLEQIPLLIRVFADDAACGANGQPTPTTSWRAIDSVQSLIDYITEHDIRYGDGARWVGQVAMIAYDYGLFDIGAGIDLDSYAQYCPCPSQGAQITGCWNMGNGYPNPYTLTRTGNTVTFHNGNNTVTGSGTLNGLVLTGTWANTSNATSGTFTWTFNEAVTSIDGIGINTSNVQFAWDGVKTTCV